VRWTNARMKSRESVPLEGRPDHPYTESGGQVTYREGFSQPSGREPEAPWEEEAIKLGLQASPSCPDVSARSGMVIVMVLLPHHGMCGMMLQCRSWRHCWHGGGSPVVLRDVVSPWPSSSSLSSWWRRGDSSGAGSLS
jgi:hypothetical protein